MCRKLFIHLFLVLTLGGASPLVAQHDFYELEYDSVLKMTDRMKLVSGTEEVFKDKAGNTRYTSWLWKWESELMEITVSPGDDGKTMYGTVNWKDSSGNIVKHYQTGDGDYWLDYYIYDASGKKVKEIGYEPPLYSGREQQKNVLVFQYDDKGRQTLWIGHIGEIRDTIWTYYVGEDSVFTHRRSSDEDLCSDKVEVFNVQGDKTLEHEVNCEGEELRLSESMWQYALNKKKEYCEVHSHMGGGGNWERVYTYKGDKLLMLDAFLRPAPDGPISYHQKVEYLPGKTVTTNVLTGEVTEKIELDAKAAENSWKVFNEK